MLVRKGGLEPPRAAPPAPKAGASTDSATFASRRPAAFRRTHARESQPAAPFARVRFAVPACGVESPAAAFAERAIIADAAGVRQRRDRARALHAPTSLESRALHPVSAAHYENFPVASFLLPRAQRDAVLAIYGFARAADDIADEGDASPATRLADLDRFERALDAIEAGRPPREAPFAALAAAIGRHALPIAPFRDLLSAFRQDVLTHRYGSEAELLDYC